MPAWIVTLIGYVLGGAGILSFIIFLIQRHDQKKGLADQLKSMETDFDKRFTKMEKDNVRTQLLLLMYNYQSSDESELLTCAEHYFKDLEGDWYMTPKFNRFIKENEIAKPEWLD